MSESSSDSVQAIEDGVHKIDAESVAQVTIALDAWAESAKGLPVEHAIEYKTRDYYQRELASMRNPLNSKWGKSEQWYGCWRGGQLCTVAHLDVRPKQISLSHIVGRPSTMPVIEGRPSTTTVMMDYVKQFSLAQPGPPKLILNAEVLPLIPLYRYYGFRMSDTEQQKTVEAFELSLRDSSQGAKDASWASEGKKWGWRTPPMEWVNV